jgi:hypothetical protein
MQNKLILTLVLFLLVLAVCWALEQFANVPMAASVPACALLIACYAAV